MRQLVLDMTRDFLFCSKEVDLVVELGDKTTAIEIKATSTPIDSDFAGLAAFQEMEKCDAAYLVCQVERPQTFRHGTAIPWYQLWNYVDINLPR